MVSGRRASVQRTVGTTCRKEQDRRRERKQTQLAIIIKQACNKISMLTFWDVSFLPSH